MRLRRSSRGKGEAGYAVLLAIFLVATMLLLAAAATPNVLTEGRRLREQEAIWRGNQYVRAIRLYYQKNGKYPASLEDLAKPNAAGVHFLRKSYKEPMNSSDGSWRLIYVTPSGQLVGSVHFHTLQEMAVAAAFAGQLPGSVAGLASQLFGQVSLTPSDGAQLGTTGPSGAQSGQQNTSQGAQFGATQPGLGGQNSPGSIASSTQPTPLQAADSTVFGGSVIGVASKVKQSSIIVYQDGKTYFEWEFLWNPLLNATAGAPGQPVLPAQPGLGGFQPGINGGQAPTGGLGGLGGLGGNNGFNLPGNSPGTAAPITPQPNAPVPGGQPQPMPGPQN